MIAQEVIKAMQSDKCYTMSRSRSKKKRRNFSNKYTKCLGARGCKGIRKDGYFTKFYSYGVVGHCCIGVQAHLIWAGYEELVPKTGYRWNTNKYAAWLRTEPTIKGLGKVDWTTDWKKAKKAAEAGKLVVVFKGKKGKKSYSHTCALLEIKNGKVKTVDFNVAGKYKGKRINNGVVKSRKRTSYRWGFAILPIPTKKPAPYQRGKTYTLQNTMNVRTEPSVTKGRVKATMKRGSKVKALVVKKINDVYWVLTVHGWVCAKTKTKTYMK